MTDKGTVVVLYNEIPKDAAPDELDTLAQADLVAASLAELGFKTVKMAFSLDFKTFKENLRTIAPGFIFNLVESVANEGKLSHFAPFLLEHLGIKYSGCPGEAIYQTTNKLLTKKLLRLSEVNTPGWIFFTETVGFKQGAQYIIKPVSEDASIGLEGDFFINAVNPARLQEVITAKQQRFGKEFFAEEYIDGREFNISILGRGGEPEILPPSEIKFIGYRKAGKAKVVDYKAKWVEDSFEFRNTRRTFEFGNDDLPLLNEMRAITKLCWDCFRLKGYARVDFRVDDNNKPWVLEVNANPCLTPGSGFAAAATEAGLTFTELVGRIVSEI